MNIVIPSYKRPNDVVVLNSIPESYKHKTFLYVRKEEEEAYAENYSEKCTIIPLTNVSCYSSTMAAIFDHQGKERVFYVDDDDSFHTSYIDKNCYVRANKELINEDEFYDMMKMFNDLADEGYVHGGLRILYFPVGEEVLPYQVNKRIFSNCWFDMNVIPREWIDHGEFDIYTDTSVVLNLWERGYSSAAITKYLASTVPPKKQDMNSGTHSYRTADLHNRAMEEICAKYSKYAKFVTTTNKNNVVPGAHPDAQVNQFRIRVPSILPNQVSPAINTNTSLENFF